MGRLGRLWAWLGVMGVALASSDAWADQPPIRLVMVIAEQEYDTRRTLPEFARRFLGQRYAIEFVTAPDVEGRDDLRGLESVDSADLVLLSVRRRAPTMDQLAALRRYLDEGGPLVAIRTSCHAFSLRGERPPPGHATWENFDRDVLGCRYDNHHPDGQVASVSRASTADAASPLLEGVQLPFSSRGSLYLVSPLAENASPLLMGEIVGAMAEPVAWTTTAPGGGRVFVTTLGHADDFADEAFRRLLANGIDWSVQGRSE